jgi:nucleoside-diphosphate-sugar epimerase
MTTVLVSGATGFVGSHVVRSQVCLGAEVHALVRPGADQWRLADLTESYSLVVADLRDPDVLTAAVRSLAPDRVFHLGAATMHAGQSARPRELIDTNLVGTVTLLNACRNLDIEAFVNVGDAFEYGPGSGAVDENTPCRPTSLDGITKLAATQYAAALATADGLPVVTIRPFSIIGRDDDPRRLVPRLVASARTGEQIALSDRGVTRDFVAVADVIELLCLAADQAGRMRGSAFNCGSGVATTLGELVATVEKVSGRLLDAEWGVFPVTEHDLDHPVANPGAAGRLLGWRPTMSLEAMIEDLWIAS